MLIRTIVLTAVIASCVSSLVTLTVALLVLAPSIRAASDRQDEQDVVRTRRLEVVDSQGVVRAVLGTLPDRDGVGREMVAYFRMYQRNGTMASELSTEGGGSRLSLMDLYELARVHLTAWAGPASGSIVGLELSDHCRPARVWIGNADAAVGYQEAGPFARFIPAQGGCPGVTSGRGALQNNYTAYIRGIDGPIIWQAP